MSWTVKIEDPSGETRLIPLKGEAAATATLGQTSQSTILLRDPTLPSEIATLWANPTGSKKSDLSPFWIKISQPQIHTTLGGVAFREAQLPLSVPIKLGESTLTLLRGTSSISLPQFPSGVRPWLTQSESGKDILWMTKKAAATPLSIYLAGETGTGKEVLAHLIHAWSDRASGPFVPLHCGALPLSLAESELFGHIKGAFTGAVVHRSGALMQAHNGTLFLDEVGDLPLDIQVKLLRFLENGEIKPVGADRSSKADVRLICATHHPLEKLVEEGKFRRDLYYRLASVTIQITPIHSRVEDIEMLAEKFAAELGRSLSPKALLRLQAHQWPGNVRELRHAIERASGLAGPFVTTLGEESFEFLMNAESTKSSPDLQLGAPVLTLKEMERVLILRALKIARGNRAKAANILGVARSTLFEMLKRHRIRGPKTADFNVDALSA